jgi:aryl-alcohol dehydrogenase-like predicted oxidoreductase
MHDTMLSARPGAISSDTASLYTNRTSESFLGEFMDGHRRA